MSDTSTTETLDIERGALVLVTRHDAIDSSDYLTLVVPESDERSVGMLGAQRHALRARARGPAQGVGT